MTIELPDGYCEPAPVPLALGSSEGLGLYPERDHAAQAGHYLRHIDAMTREGLHAKSRIAGELAARDIEIERLRAAVQGLLDAMPSSHLWDEPPPRLSDLADALLKAKAVARDALRGA